MTKPQNPVQMAVIGAAHGIKGELRVKTFTGEPLALADYGPLYARDGRAFQIIDIRPANTVVVVRFKGVSRPQRRRGAGRHGTVRRPLDAAGRWRGGRILSCRPRRAGGPGRHRRRHRQGRRRAQFRRRRHSRCDAWRAQGRADPVHAGRRAAKCRSPRASFASTRRRPGWSTTRMAMRRRDEDFDPKGRPRGPKDAGGNR